MNIKKSFTLNRFLKKKKWNNVRSEYVQHVVQKALQLCERQAAWQQLSILTATTTSTSASITTTPTITTTTDAIKESKLIVCYITSIL